jgi:hypothetical protein
VLPGEAPGEVLKGVQHGDHGDLRPAICDASPQEQPRQLLGQHLRRRLALGAVLRSRTQNGV